MRAQVRSGYTLLELITVIAMMGVLATLMTSVWFQIMNGWHLTKTRADLDRRVYNAFEQMRRDFDMMLAPGRGGAPLEGTAHVRTTPVERLGPLRTTLETASDSVAFVTARPNLEGLLEAQRVSYRIERPKADEAGGMVLVRAVSGVDAPEDAAEQLSPLLSTTTELRIEYLREGEWLPAWSQDVLPEAVRVSLTAMVPEDEARPDTEHEAISRVAVFPVRVQ